MPSLITSETPVKSDFICDCEESLRSACVGEIFYREYEGKQYCVLHFPSKEKSIDFQKALKKKIEDKDFNFRGVWFPDGVSFRDFTFDVEVDFRLATFNEYADFQSAIFKAEARFTSATFNSTAHFHSAKFNAAAEFFYVPFNAKANFGFVTFNADADFNSAIFNAEAWFTVAKFNADANFHSTIFNAVAIFAHTTFNPREKSLPSPTKAWFYSAKFNVLANFNEATFNVLAEFDLANFKEAAKFISATFNIKATFSSTTFNEEADFKKAIFNDYVRFAGDQEHGGFGDLSWLDLQHVRIENPAHFSFHTLKLCPHWFVNVDAREFDFTNVEWISSITQEIKELKVINISHPHRLLALAYRRLAVNAEENHRYDDASNFRYAAMDVRRRESWLGLAPWRLSWWYWAASGYGERVFRAFLILLGVWLLFAWFYTEPKINWLYTNPNVGFAHLGRINESSTTNHEESVEPLEFSDALTYSAGVMLLQKPEPRPTTRLARGLVIFQTILGPLQSALLALAIRRKFMR